MLSATYSQRRLVLLLCASAVTAALAESLALFMVARLALGVTSGADTVDLGFGPLPTTSLPLEEAVLVSLIPLSVALLLTYPVSRLVGMLSRNTIVHFRSTVISRYLACSWAARAGDPEGRLQEHISEYSHRVERLVSSGSAILVSTISIFILLAYAVLITPVGALGLLVGLGVLGLALRPVTQRLKRGSIAFAEANRQLSSRVAQTARVSQEIAAYDVASEVTGSLQPDIEASGRLIGRIRLAATLVPMLYQYAALALIIGLVGIMAITNPAGLEDIGPVLLLFIRALGYARQIQARSQEGVEFTPYLEALDAELQRLAEGVESHGSRRLDRLDHLRFDDVSFAYVASNPVLEGLDLELERGTAIGLVGSSGAGKSTIVQLTLRLRMPTTGRILANGVDVREVSTESWARLIAYVPQENKLINGSVADNIRFFRQGYPEDAVRHAAAAAHLDADIAEFPDGYDTVIGPGARDLSGGQRQRLGIARALLAAPDCLVLDEPTSALDERSESLVRQTLAALKGTTMLIIVAHRPGILDVCDSIALVKDGTVGIRPHEAVGTLEEHLGSR